MVPSRRKMSASRSFPFSFLGPFTQPSKSSPSHKPIATQTRAREPHFVLCKNGKSNGYRKKEGRHEGGECAEQAQTRKERCHRARTIMEMETTLPVACLPVCRRMSICSIEAQSSFLLLILPLCSWLLFLCSFLSSRYIYPVRSALSRVHLLSLILHPAAHLYFSLLPRHTSPFSYPLPVPVYQSRYQ